MSSMQSPADKDTDYGYYGTMINCAVLPQTGTANVQLADAPLRLSLPSQTRPSSMKSLQLRSNWLGDNSTSYTYNMYTWSSPACLLTLKLLSTRLQVHDHRPYGNHCCFRPFALQEQQKQGY